MELELAGEVLPVYGIGRLTGGNARALVLGLVLGFLLLILLLLGLLLPHLPALCVLLPADSGRHSGLLAGLQPVGILGDALALRFPVVVQDAAVACLIRPHDGWLRRPQLRIGGVFRIPVLAGKAAEGIVEWIEFLY